MNNDGFLLVHKPAGSTSFQIIGALRRILQIRKIGHAGILDMAASGLLLVGTGKATRLLRFLLEYPKTYIAHITFGNQTTTDDGEGEVIREYTGKIDLSHIEKILPDFTGSILQVPPDYSSIHVNGKRAYQISLKGEKPELSERKVEIKNLKIIGYQEPVLTVEVECSKGTYIRSLARDMGIRTGYFAYLSGLIRTKIGNFILENAFTLEQIRDGRYKVLSPFETIDSIPALAVMESFIPKIRNGIKPEPSWFENAPAEDGVYKVHDRGELLAVVSREAEILSYILVY